MMEMTMCFPLLLLICSLSTAQLQTESDNEIIPHGNQAGSQGREPTNASDHQQTCTQDIHAVLREMSALLAEQRVEMRHLQRENEVQAAKLRELELQKTEVDRLKQQLQAQAAELITVKARSNVIEIQVEALKRDGEVRGAYHFEFCIGAGGDNSHPSGAVLVKNGEHICIAYEHQTSGYGSSAKGTTLLLEVGDVVFLRQWVNSRISDNENHHSTFSGHLLFTM
ncbi:hypothetical protein EPR50_G00078280 [Perca flavescens]|uniref:C1q domain-containing protein n=1 Tax=Perca flavescens TaxID=8167 RepID=A0A484D5T4_PERFV|nr:hypothetical protein EPR50_G00078280 [Perca flavescens]